MFKYFNPHPKGTSVNTGDCVKRAIVVTTGIDYKTVQKGLNAFKNVTGAKSFNSDHNPHRYVEDVLCAKRIEVPKATTVSSFCKSHPRGRFILDIPRHWVGIYNANYYDTWDCGKEKVNFAYEIATEEYISPPLECQRFRYCCTSEKISDKETRIRIYDGNGSFTERKIPTELTAGYIRCLQDSNYNYIELQTSYMLDKKAVIG